MIETIVFSSTRASFLNFPSELEASVLSIKNEYPPTSTELWFHYIFEGLKKILSRSSRYYQIIQFQKQIYLRGINRWWWWKAEEDAWLSQTWRNKCIYEWEREIEKGLLRKTRKSKVDKEEGGLENLIQFSHGRKCLMGQWILSCNVCRAFFII